MPPKRRLSGDDVEEGGEKKRKKLEEPQQIQVSWTITMCPGSSDPFYIVT